MEFFENHAFWKSLLYPPIVCPALFLSVFVTNDACLAAGFLYLNVLTPFCRLEAQLAPL